METRSKVSIEESKVNYYFKMQTLLKVKSWRLLDDRIVCYKNNEKIVEEIFLEDITKFDTNPFNSRQLYFYVGDKLYSNLIFEKTDMLEGMMALDYIREHCGDLRQIIKKESKNVEYRMRCNVCGKVFCYSYQDILDNQAHAKWATAHAVGSMANAVFGSAYLMNEESKKADAETSKIRDFSKCPYCNSSSLTELSADEWEKSMTEKQPSIQPVGGSVADEIKKFKELLDIGAITQEEFDAKKKQLLGL